jgi:hypothetical protein
MKWIRVEDIYILARLIYNKMHSLINPRASWAILRCDSPIVEGVTLLWLPRLTCLFPTIEVSVGATIVKLVWIDSSRWGVSQLKWLAIIKVPSVSLHAGCLVIARLISVPINGRVRVI